MTNTNEIKRKIKKRIIIIPIAVLLIIIAVFAYPYVLARFGGSFGYTMELPFSNRLFYIDSNSEHIEGIGFGGSGFNDVSGWNPPRPIYRKSDDGYKEIIDILNAFRYSKIETDNPSYTNNYLEDFVVAFDYVEFWFSPEENTIFVYTDKAGNGIRYYSAEEGYFDRFIELGGGIREPLTNRPDDPGPFSSEDEISE